MADKGEPQSEQFFTVVQQMDVAGLTFVESVSQANFIVPPHRHQETHLTLMLAGHCLDTYAKRRRSLSPMTALYFHPGEVHALQVFQQPICTFDIELRSPWLAHHAPPGLAQAARLESLSPSSLWLMTRLYNEFKVADEVSPLAIEGLMLEICAHLVRAAKGESVTAAPPWLHQVLDKMRDEFARPLTLSGLAKAVGVHPSHLAQVFRQHHHCTPGEFLRRLRIERAMQYLIDMKLSLAEIAFATGFSDQSHFSRLFKRATGLTPTQFRKLHHHPKHVQNTRDTYKTEPGISIMIVGDGNPTN